MQGNQARYNAYFHCKDNGAISQDFVRRHKIAEYFPWKRGFGRYQGIKAMYKHSIRNGDYKMILLSDSTIPLKSFDYVYEYLMRDDKSYIAHQPQHGGEVSIVHGLHTVHTQYEKYLECVNRFAGFRATIKIEHFHYNEAWTILNAKHARLILEDELIMQAMPFEFSILV